MKKLLLLSILLIVGCSTMRNIYQKEFRVEKSTAFFQIGMTEEEFIRKNPDITEKLNESDEFTTYINSEQPYKYILFIKTPLAFEKYMFEFKNDTLIAVYRGKNNYDREIDYSKYPNFKPK